MSAEKIASIICEWNAGDARSLPSEKLEKIKNLWVAIEIKKGYDFMLETIVQLENIENTK